MDARVAAVSTTGVFSLCFFHRFSARTPLPLRREDGRASEHAPKGGEEEREAAMETGLSGSEWRGPDGELAAEEAVRAPRWCLCVWMRRG